MKNNTIILTLTGLWLAWCAIAPNMVMTFPAKWFVHDFNLPGTTEWFCYDISLALGLMLGFGMMIFPQNTFTKIVGGALFTDCIWIFVKIIVWNNEFDPSGSYITNAVIFVTIVYFYIKHHAGVKRNK